MRKDKELLSMFLLNMDNKTNSTKTSPNQSDLVLVTYIPEKKNSKRNDKNIKDETVIERNTNVVNFYDLMNVLDYQETQFLEFTEVNIDVDKLQFIVSNRHIFEPLLKRGKTYKYEKYEHYDPFLLASKYLAKSRNHSVKVVYKQKRGVGRFNAKGSLSLQCLKRQIRQTISTGYLDIDIVNAHPNILKFVCTENGYPCPILIKYCKNRDKFIKENSFTTKAHGKLVFLCIMNGGTEEYKALENPSKEMVTFASSEILNIHNLIAAKHSEQFEAHKKARIAKGKNYNHKASFMNIILCDIENKLLMAMHEYFGSSRNDVLCFDGLMPLNGKKYDLDGCQKHIFDKYHIKIELAIKPFDEAFDLSMYSYPIYKEISLSYYEDFENLVSKTIDLEIATEWLNNAIKWISNGGGGYFLTKNSNIDHLTQLNSIHYKPVKKETLLGDLEFVCNIENSKFDIDYWSAHKNDKKKGGLDLEKMQQYLFTMLGSKRKDNNSFIDTFLKTGKISIFKSVDFFPFLERKGVPNLNGKFNMFSGFPLEKVEQTKQIDFTKSALYKHIKEELMNNNEEEFNHFLDHIADMIQDPANIKSIGHLFFTHQGMGKGLLAEFVAKLLGPDHCITFGNTDAYFSNFNSDQANKILKIFEEVSDKGVAFKNHDRLKGDQSKKTERIEPKGLDPYTIMHCARYWYFTNHPHSLYIEGDNRRITCHKANSRYANIIEYFEILWQEIRDIQFCKCAFEFFASRKYTFKSVTTCFENNFKKEQKEINLCSTHQFLKEYAENGGLDNLSSPKVKCSDLSDAYHIWCTNSGTQYHLNTFKTQLAKIDINACKVRYDGIGTWCYILDFKILTKKFSELLKDPTFEFKNQDYIDEEVEEQIKKNAKEEELKQTKSAKKSNNKIKNTETFKSQKINLDSDDDENFQVFAKKLF